MLCLVVISYEPVLDIRGWMAGHVSPDRVPRHFSPLSTPITEMLWLLAEVQGQLQPDVIPLGLPRAEGAQGMPCMDRRGSRPVEPQLSYLLVLGPQANH